jgi:hypothetical protein
LILDAPRLKKISTIKGLEDFILYGVDTDGNVYSWKNRKPKLLKPGWAKSRDGYLYVRLSDIKGNIKNLFVHRLVCMAFLPCDDFTYDVRHKNKKLQDNTLENLEWIARKERYKEDTGNNGFMLDDDITEKFKRVHIASIRKGLNVPNDKTFLNNLLDRALEDHIKQFGLHKVMN